MFCTRCIRATAASRQIYATRSFSASARFLSAEPALSTPLTPAGERPQPAVQRSICPEGTVFNGLNYHKNGKDPVAMKDEDYPEWLWKCLEVTQKKSDGGDDDAADEFSKSKKVRKAAAKRQRLLEAKLLAEGNLEALAPKVPLQHQSINLPGREGGTIEENLEAAGKRQQLRRAMREERRAKIKESNYLKSM
ncbi:mitochondrial ribosomal protein L37-domain-containing protein [Stachybotrys elegans]|uniref:Large ribosomal subunit protein mL54 n=1 Tax=Stachybotrys elegans TaxID=80388 RepID=A0A8K0T5V0_9HYPO|nr:mitochondrial ribosomal protein L37-domain-containing protein [Stachybotrys elegans]